MATASLAVVLYVVVVASCLSTRVASLTPAASVASSRGSGARLFPLAACRQSPSRTRTSLPTLLSYISSHDITGTSIQQHDVSADSGTWNR